MTGQPHIRAGRRGSVLLIVLITVALLAMLVVTMIASRTSSELSVTASTDAAQQGYCAKGGIEIARLLLRNDFDDSKNDTLFELWAQRNTGKIGTYECKIDIADEDRKISMIHISSNSPETVKVLSRLLSLLITNLSLEEIEEEVGKACEKMQEDLELKGKAVTSPADLLRYKFFTEKIVYGQKDETGEVVSPGLVEYITFQYIMKTNINTAPREVLLTLLDFDNEELVEKVIAFRQMEDEDGKIAGIEDISEMSKNRQEPEEGEPDLRFSDEEVSLLEKNFGTTSRIFTVTATVPAKKAAGATGGGYSRGWVLLAERSDKGKIKTISIRKTLQQATDSESEK